MLCPNERRECQLHFRAQGALRSRISTVLMPSTPHKSHPFLEERHIVELVSWCGGIKASMSPETEGCQHLLLAIAWGVKNCVPPVSLGPCEYYKPRLRCPSQMMVSPGTKCLLYLEGDNQEAGGSSS